MKIRFETYAETRDHHVWTANNAMRGWRGLTVEDCFETLEHGYQCVLRGIHDAERQVQWQAAHRKMQESHAFFKQGDEHNGAKVLFEAHELFTTLRRIGGKKPCRQELGDTEHGANELDE
jgi:hypothetical protein